MLADRNGQLYKCAEENAPGSDKALDKDVPNAYAFMDDQRNVEVDGGYFQIARLRLFRVEANMSYSMGHLKLQEE